MAVNARSTITAQGWQIYRGTGKPHPGIAGLPPPPPWRRFGGDLTTPVPVLPANGTTEPPGVAASARSYLPDPHVVDTVNAALYLRRPLLVTGKPGTGKSTLAYSVAYELGLGPVLYWPITSRSTLQDALYRYDAIGRLQETNLRRRDSDETIPEIGRYVRLGPLGTALLPWPTPRVLLIDEVDKSDIDLPNDLLNVFEEGQFEVPELSRLPDELRSVEVRTHDGGHARIDRGLVRAREFPLVVITNNGEREFPPAFLRRCVSLTILPPDAAKLREIVSEQLGAETLRKNEDLVNHFLNSRENGDLSTDQLLNLIFLTTTGRPPAPDERDRLTQLLLHPLGSAT
jgi:MoxR-like ATPase